MKRIVLVVSLIVLLGGCSYPAVEAPSGPTVVPQGTASPTRAAPVTQAWTEPVSIPTLDYSPAGIRPIVTSPPLPTAKPSNMTQDCLSLVMDPDQLPEEDFGTLAVDGFVVEKWVYSTFDEAYLFRPHDREITLKTGFDWVYPHSFAISPDQTKLAILYNLYEPADAGKDDFFVFDHNGSELTHLKFPENLRGAGMIAWLAQGILLMVKYDEGSSNSFTNYILYDPFTQKLSNLQTSFPNHYAPDYDYFGTDEVYYDPSLSRAIYLGAEKWAMDTLYLSLWDISRNQETARLNLSAYPPGSNWSIDSGFRTTWQGAVWSRNGQFAIINTWLGDQYGLARISRDGKIDTVVQGKVDQYSISPDSNLLAYWFEAGRAHEESTLYVKDLETGEIRDYCLKTGVALGMVWSPDSKNLALSFSHQDSVITVIVDFAEHEAVRINDVAIPVAWLR